MWALAWVTLSPAWSSDARAAVDWVRMHGGSVTVGEGGGIRRIDLSRSWITDIDLERIRGIETIETLKLAQTHITDRALAVVDSLPSLTELDLFFCEHITDAGASQLRGAHGLERLNVRGTKISDSGVKFLTELQNLRELDIGITEIGDTSVDLLESMPFLESLAIGGNRIGEPGIASLRTLRRLRHLDLSGAQVTDSGVWAVTVTDLNLDEIGALEELQSLNLAAPSREYVEAISTGVPRLRGAIRVTDAGALHLARLTGLRRLDLSRSELTAKGIERLEGLAFLEELVLAHAESIDDSAGPAIAMLRSLRTLDVSFTQFGDAGLAGLSGLPGLRRVVSTGAPLSDRAIEAFEAAGLGRNVIR